VQEQKRNVDEGKVVNGLVTFDGPDEDTPVPGSLDDCQKDGIFAKYHTT
jgi:hypothetical protein